MIDSDHKVDAALDEDLARLLAGDVEATTDPFPLFARLREQGPVFWHEGSLPFVTTHAGALRVFGDPDTFNTHRGKERFNYDQLSPELQGMVDDIVAFEALQMNEMNGESHRRVRAAAQRAFPRERIAEIGAYIQIATDELLDTYLRDGSMDFMDVARRLPVLAIVALIGAPTEDVDKLKAWGDAIAAVKPFYGGGFPEELIRGAHAAVGNMKSYVAEMVEKQKDRAGTTAMLSSLINSEEDDRLTPDELAGTVSLFIYAAHETTTNLLGMGLFHLLTNRSEWDKLKNDPAKVPAAIEEILRFTSPVQMMTRLAVADAEVGGELIPAGTRTMILYAGANRDPAVYANPDVFDVDRRPRNHLGFGYGAHVCIGNALAREEGKVVFQTLLRRFEDIQLASDPDVLPWHPHPVFRGVESVPVAVVGDKGAGSAPSTAEVRVGP